MIIHCNLEQTIFSQSQVAGSMSPKKPQKPSQSSPALETLQKKKAGSVAGSTICQRKPPAETDSETGFLQDGRHPNSSCLPATGATRPGPWAQIHRAAAQRLKGTPGTSGHRDHRVPALTVKRLARL